MRSELNSEKRINPNLAEQSEEVIEKPSLLLHSCCGPCSTAVVERLIKSYEVTIFFYNPNITDKEEYEKRKAAQKSFVEQYNLNPDREALLHFLEGEYNPSQFYEAVKGHEQEPEGGERCKLCFDLRLEKTACTGAIGGFDYFTTTLSVSPHKNHELIKKIGSGYSMRCGLGFLQDDFKKKDGFKRSIELSNKYNLYRQNYCGCEYSK